MRYFPDISAEHLKVINVAIGKYADDKGDYRPKEQPLPNKKSPQTQSFPHDHPPDRPNKEDEDQQIKRVAMRNATYKPT